MLCVFLPEIPLLRITQPVALLEYTVCYVNKLDDCINGAEVIYSE